LNVEKLADDKQFSLNSHFEKSNPATASSRATTLLMTSKAVVVEEIYRTISLFNISQDDSQDDNDLDLSLSLTVRQPGLNSIQRNVEENRSAIVITGSPTPLCGTFVKPQNNIVSKVSDELHNASSRVDSRPDIDRPVLKAPGWTHMGVTNRKRKFPGPAGVLPLLARIYYFIEFVGLKVNCVNWFKLAAICMVEIKLDVSRSMPNCLLLHSKSFTVNYRSR